MLTGFVTGQWGKPAGNGFRNSPYLYSTLDSFAGKYPTGFTRTAAASDFAEIDQSVNATSDRTAELLVYGRNPGLGGSVAEILNYDLPARRTVYVDADTRWETDLNEVVEMPGWPFPDAVTTLQTVPRTYQVGRSYRERLNAAALGPAPEHATRDQAHLKLSLPGLSDADGHFGESLTDTASGQLYRNGEPIGFEFPWFGRYDNYELPAEKADYKYVTSLTRPSYSKLSSRIDYSWSFSSSAADKVLPMLAVRYQPAVDGTNTAARPTVTTLPVQVVAQPGQPVPAVRKAELAVSGDGGATWKNAPLVPLGGGKYQAVFGTPAGSAVSLKAKIVDAAGNVTEQTVIGAYLLK